MPPPLQDGQVSYPDGTEATISQMAKDVSVFLAWCSEPEHDDRKKVIEDLSNTEMLLYFAPPFSLSGSLCIRGIPESFPCGLLF